MSAAALLWAATLLATAPGEARPGAPTGPVRWQRIGNESGLSHNSVYALLQDRQGFLWVGTVDGLDRYDGYEFVHYRHDPRDEGTLSNPIVRSLLEDGHGRLWVGTDNGVCRLDRRTGRFTRYALPPRDGHPVRLGWTLHLDRRGRIWLGTERGLWRFDEDAARFVPHPLLTPAGAELVNKVIDDPSGSTWAFSHTPDGLRSLLHRVVEGNPAPPYRFEAPVEPDYAWPVFFDRNGRLWTRHVPARMDHAARRILRASPGRSAPPAEAVSSTILEDRSGTFWFGTVGHGVFRLPKGAEAVTHEPLDAGAGWLRNSVRAMIEDRAGAIWLGTYTGLHRYDPHDKPFRCLAHDRADPQSLSASAVSALWEAPDGVLWAGTFGGGLNRLDRASGRLTRYRARAGDRTALRHDLVWAIQGDRRGRIWLATEEGLCSLDPRTGRFRWHELPGLVPGFSRLPALALDETETLWVGSPNGVHAIDARTGRLRQSSMLGKGDPGRNLGLDSLLPDGQGGLWMGTGARGLLLRHLQPGTGTLREHPLRALDGASLNAEGVWMIHRRSAGEMWLATGAGLSRLDPRTGQAVHYFERDGLPGAIVYAILEDGRGRLWLSTDRGLSLFDEAAPAGRRFRNFDASDGICGNEFNRGAALRARSGELLFGGVDGITLFDPEAVRDNPHVPPVAIIAVEVWGEEGTRAVPPHGLERLTLSSREDSFAVSFAALSFGQAQKNRYAYRLEGLDRDWVDARGRRFARYTSVPPGRYTFRVKGSNPDGVWNEHGASLAITVTPPFWQTAWFRLLAVSAVAGLLYGGYRYRVARLLEMERLRLRIAGDLHDDLSSDLSAVAVVTDMIQRRPGLPEDDRRHLAEVRDKALQMVDAVRDTVWYVQPEHDTLEAMVRRMKATAASLLGETPCAFEVDLEEGRESIHMAARRSVFLIYKELLHNVARHARASDVAVSLSVGSGRLTLEVRDDGVGFDTTGRHGGEGLRSLRRRAEQIGARFELGSRPGEGTKARLVLELARTRDGGSV